MRMVGAFALGGAAFGALAGVFAHFASYKAREGVFLVGGNDDLGQVLVRPPWTDLLGWAVAGLVIGVILVVGLRALGFRLVRIGRPTSSGDTTE